MIKAMDGAGLTEVKDYITKAYQDRMELWGKYKQIYNSSVCNIGYGN